MESKKIKLSCPDMKQGASLMEALAKRKSVRSFNNKPLEMDDLSGLLWAADGINRTEKNGHTAGSAMNLRPVSLYVSTPQGTCLYCPEEHALIPVTETNLIPYFAGGQEYMNNAPVVLLLVADYAVYAGGPAESMGAVLAGLDMGIVSQNISLFCSGNGLDTVARGIMDIPALKAHLQLKETQQPILNHPVGYAL